MTDHATLLSTLSRREAQMLNLLLSGHTATSAAETLCASVKTTSTYRTRIYEKLGLNYPIGSSCNAELFTFAQAAGLLELRPLALPPVHEKQLASIVAAMAKEVMPNTAGAA